MPVLGPGGQEDGVQAGAEVPVDLGQLHFPIQVRAAPDALDKGAGPLLPGEIRQQAAAWPNRKLFAVLGLLREYDARSKGLGGGGASDGELLRELLLKIFLL